MKSEGGCLATESSGQRAGNKQWRRLSSLAQARRAMWNEQVGDCLGGVARRSALFVAMWGQHRRTTYTRRKQAELVGHDQT